MLIKIEKNSPTWFPDEQNMTSVYEAQDFRFNGDDNWDLIISDGNDDDVLMDYLDVRDSLDTMTCVEADLSELPENDDVVLLGPDIKNDTEDDDGVVSKNPSRSRVEDKRSEDLCSKQHESGADTEGHVAKRFETITVSTDTETEAKADVVISDDLSSVSEDCNAKVERNRMDGNEMGTLLINAEETKKVAVIEPETTVSDLSSPELLKDSCLGAMVSKLRLAVQRTKSQGGFSLKSVKGDDGGVVGGPDKTLESAPKKAGQDKIEAEKKLKQKEAEGSGNVNAENNEKLDVGVSRDIDISSPVDVGQTRHADAEKGKGNFSNTVKLYTFLNCGHYHKYN